MYVASLVLGILSFILCLIPGIGTLLSIVAFIVSIVAVCKKEHKSGRGMSIAGLVLSSISIVISVIVIIGIILFANFAVEGAHGILNELRDSDLGEYISAEVKLMEKYTELEFKNEDKIYTGYIDRNTGEYVEKFSGMEADDYYEEYMESIGFDVDIYVNVKGQPMIEKEF